MRAPERLNMYGEGGFVTDMRSPGSTHASNIIPDMPRNNTEAI